MPRATDTAPRRWKGHWQKRASVLEIANNYQNVLLERLDISANRYYLCERRLCGCVSCWEISPNGTCILIAFY
jgi:limonene-1,2-epoxide hydrolase